jgi:RNA polymerase sigma-70 factor (ECF subfamily)
MDNRDNILVSQIQNGNIGAFEDMFNIYYDELVNFAYKYLFDIEQSEDLVQNLFLYIWENRSRIKISKSLKGYLYTSVKNRSLNQLKKIKLYDNNDILSINAVLTTEDDITDTGIITDLIKEIVKSLPPRMSDIFIKKALKGYTVKEISDELNISQNTVKTQLQRARDKIRETLKKKI